MKKYCVYSVKCKIDNSVYYGRTSSVNSRKNSHFNGVASNVIKKKIERFGIKNIKFRIIRSDLSFKKACDLEYQLILKAKKSEISMNKRIHISATELECVTTVDLGSIWQRTGRTWRAMEKK